MSKYVFIFIVQLIFKKIIILSSICKNRVFFYTYYFRQFSLHIRYGKKKIHLKKFKQHFL